MRIRQALLLGSVLCSAVACHPKRLGHVLRPGGPDRPVSVRAQLTCPSRVDDLTLISKSATGAACSYGNVAGLQVQLSLVPLNGLDAQASLSQIETQLKGDLPAAAEDGNTQTSDVKSGDHAKIDLPGLHMTASGDKADIRLPGVSINADGDDAKISTGWGAEGGSTVNAHSGGAEIRTVSSNVNGVSVEYLLAAQTPGPTGYRTVGYVAKGPVAGPLVVGVFEDRRSHQRYDEHDLDRLVDLNVHSR